MVRCIDKTLIQYVSAGPYNTRSGPQELPRPFRRNSAQAMRLFQGACFSDSIAVGNIIQRAMKPLLRTPITGHSHRAVANPMSCIDQASSGTGLYRSDL